MTLRNLLLAWHIATRQNPRMAVALEQAIRGKDDLAPFQAELKKRLTDQFSQQLIAAKHVPFIRMLMLLIHHDCGKFRSRRWCFFIVGSWVC